MSSIKFSVIIPTFNRMNLLSRAIDSVFLQTEASFELIVVDDGSTDETEKVLESYEHLENFRWVKTENRGVSSARNHGVGLAKGEWLAFLDSDDEWLPQKLEMQMRVMEKHPQLNLIHGEERWIRNGKFVNQRKVHKKSGGDIFERSLHLCLVSPSAVVIKKESFIHYGGFDESFPVCEDYDLWLKVSSCEEVGFVSEPIIVKYGGHDDQLSQRYFAMDYWRVKSMSRLMNSRQGLKRSQEIKPVLKRKCEILLQGYRKHKNLKNYNEVTDILASVKDFLPAEY